jgi:hypothetical protein
MLSERTLIKLQGIKKCSINGHKVKDLFQVVLNAPDLWEQAYGNIYANKGAMTPGVNGLTMDIDSQKKIRAAEGTGERTGQMLRDTAFLSEPTIT